MDRTAAVHGGSVDRVPVPDDMPQWQNLVAIAAVVLSLTIVSQFFGGCIEDIGPEPSSPDHSENVGVDGD